MICAQKTSMIIDAKIGVAITFAAWLAATVSVARPSERRDLDGELVNIFPVIWRLSLPNASTVILSGL
jgi:hypothetical protein